ncbi:MAG: WD40 repeat domain-containing protein, partial [Candidatus Hydrogenedentales bacterium]
RAIASSPTAPLMAVAGNEQVLLYALDQPRLLGALPFPEGDVFTLTFSVNGEILVAGGGEEGATGITVLWNIRTGERLGELGKAYDTVLAADISPDHTMLAVGGPNRIVRVYSTKTGDELYNIDSHTDWILAVKFSPDGELLASADRAGNLALWQAANGRAVEGLRGHEGAIHDLAYSFDSTILASAGRDGKVYLWDTWNNTQIRNFAAHTGAVFAVDFAPNGQILTAGQDGLAKRWDQVGQNLTTYPSLGDWAYQACFGQQGAIVAAGDWSGEVLLWQAESAEPAATFTTNPDPKVQVATAAAASGQ